MQVHELNIIALHAEMQFVETYIEWDREAHVIRISFENDSLIDPHFYHAPHGGYSPRLTLQEEEPYGEMYDAYDVIAWSHALIGHFDYFAINRIARWALKIEQGKSFSNAEDVFEMERDRLQLLQKSADREINEKMH